MLQKVTEMKEIMVYEMQQAAKGFCSLGRQVLESHDCFHVCLNRTADALRSTQAEMSAMRQSMQSMQGQMQAIVAANEQLQQENAELRLLQARFRTGSTVQGGETSDDNGELF